jgi:leucyl/phenylalanyl-tRNA--protein transferase
MARADGLLAVGGDLSPERLLLAYRMGIFPWYSEDCPILWWSPNPRLILRPERFHISKSLQKVIKRGVFTVTMDHAFRAVVTACAQKPRPGQDGTWIMPEMIDAYCRLHEQGHAHSVEAWQEGALVGGLYGLHVGRCFFGESMFSDTPDASKVALAALVERVTGWDDGFIDCQLPTPHLKRLGAEAVGRKTFLKMLKKACEGRTPECWGNAGNMPG